MRGTVSVGDCADCKGMIYLEVDLKTGDKWLECSNHNCPNFGKKFKIPSIELEPFE